MNQVLDKLTKFLNLEADRGYDNRAVVGGLERMLEPWKQEAEAAELDPGLIELVVSRLQDYRRLSPASRQDAIGGLLRRIERETSSQPSPGPVPEQGGTEGQPTETVAERQGDAASPQPGAVPAAPAAPQSAPPATPAPTPAPPQEQEPPAALSAPLTTIQGIGPKSAKTLAKLDLHTLGDLLWHLPRRYLDYSTLKTISRLWYGEEVSLIGTVEKIHTRSVRGGRMKLVEAVIGDGTGTLRVTWFNQPWITKSLKPGKAVVVSGKIDQYLGKLTLSNPEWETLDRKQLHTNRIVPVYPLTAGVSSKWLRRVIHSVVNRLASRVPDPLPSSIRSSAQLLPIGEALAQVHFPDDWDALKRAQHRLAFEEMFLLQLGVLRQKLEWEQLETAPFSVEDSWVDQFLTGLPYELTDAQAAVTADLRADLAATKPMNRLLQGDVGSGKTVVAAFGLAITHQNGAQGAVMAPTSILAEQHVQTLKALLPPACGIEPDSIKLLIGATPESEKEAIRAGLADGSIPIVVGTHALLEDPVQFTNLGLVVIDEQHRFGVDQRAKLREKGENPNLLVMTATPIPRSLALTIFGDLDVSVIDEMPPGRLPVETRVLYPRERSRAHSFIMSQLEKGQQGFVIYPLVEGSEKVQTKAAVDEHEKLQHEVFKDFNVGLLHGRLKPAEKEAVMADFRAEKYQLLVSTSVVEVGVDIPDATVMLIEGANRFGLAQLHQFRGRIGRGDQESYCLLIPDRDDDAENERLKAMEATSDGFELAELDLEQRGPGEFLGTRQSGFSELRTARLTDIRLIEKARREAQALFTKDPDLSDPEHRLLSATVDHFWSDGKGELS